MARYAAPFLLILSLALAACSGDGTGSQMTVQGDFHGTDDAADARGSAPEPDAPVEPLPDAASPDGPGDLSPESNPVPVPDQTSDWTADSAPDAAMCEPSCVGKECGNDGCAGSCGQCSEGEACFAGKCEADPGCSPEGCYPKVCNVATGECVSCESDGQCESLLASCDPETGLCFGCHEWCGGLECGDDGCGESCGECPAGEACVDGACLCVPECGGKSCGDDGCGGSCGDCGGGICQDGTCVQGWPDPGSGQVWQNPSTGETFSMAGGMAYCEALEWGGSSDWFLPTYEQLQTILAGDPFNGCHWKAGLEGPCGWYWSSTHQPSSNDDYYAINFQDQDIDPTDDDDHMFVRCVRTGP